MEPSMLYVYSSPSFERPLWWETTCLLRPHLSFPIAIFSLFFDLHWDHLLLCDHFGPALEVVSQDSKFTIAKVPSILQNVIQMLWLASNQDDKLLLFHTSIILITKFIWTWLAKYQLSSFAFAQYIICNCPVYNL